MRPRCRAIAAGFSFVVVSLAVPAFAGGDRVDFFDSKGHRTGYAIVNRESGRVDFYDRESRRTGWGRWEPTTRTVERFDLKGRRVAPDTAPVPGGDGRK